MSFNRRTPLIRRATLSGGEGVVRWGYHSAAVCRSWTITKAERGEWQLHAALVRGDGFMLRQRGLSFNAPRKGGWWQWPIVALTQQGTFLRATLGQPEQ